MEANKMETIFSHLNQGHPRAPCSQERRLENCIKEYNKPENVKRFEENAQSLSYRAPMYCSKLLAEIFADDIRPVKVLDVASGPGQVGTELYQLGFRNIHALDGSWAMLEACRKKNVYSDYICCVIKEDGRLPVDNASYDAVVTAGAVLEHHLPVSSLAEFARITKPGGYCVIACSSDVMCTEYGRTWQAEYKRLVEEEVWAEHYKVVVPDYYVNLPGVVDIFRVL